MWICFNKDLTLLTTFDAQSLINKIQKSYLLSNKIAFSQEQEQEQLKQNIETWNSCEGYFRKKQPKLLCTIFTTRESHMTRMKAIHDTWSKRY